MLSLYNISCARGGFPLLSGVSMTLLPGSLTILRGGNGSGKTTLIKTLAGILPMDAGEILWGDQRHNVQETMHAYHAHMHYIGHQSALFEELTVAENIAFWAHSYGVADLLPVAGKLFDLGVVWEKKITTLSQGWRRRVALAKLALGDRPIWLLDEPFSNLDIDCCQTVMQLMAARCDQGGVVILSSHKEMPIPGAIECYISDYAA